VLVYALSDAWDFLALAGTVSDLAAFGSLTNITGDPGPQFRRCTKSSFLGEDPSCTEQRKMQELRHYTRVLVTTSASAGFQSRISALGDTFSPFTFAVAPGTAMSTPGGSETLATAETGDPTFSTHSQF
jgi:hypothetical protein